MKLKVVYREESKEMFDLVDDDTSELAGHLIVTHYTAGLKPTVGSMTKFQNAKIVLDGKSLKRLQREQEEYRDG